MSIFVSSKVAVKFKLRDKQGNVVTQKSIPAMYVGELDDWVQEVPYFDDMCRSGDLTFVNHTPNIQVVSEKAEKTSKKKGK